MRVKISAWESESAKSSSPISAVTQKSRITGGKGIREEIFCQREERRKMRRKMRRRRRRRGRG